jgi:hypothetical protein
MRIPICLLGTCCRSAGVTYAEDPDDQTPPASGTTTTAPAAAPAPATPPAPPPKYSGWVFSGQAV